MRNNKSSYIFLEIILNSEFKYNQEKEKTQSITNKSDKQPQHQDGFEERGRLGPGRCHVKSLWSVAPAGPAVRLLQNRQSEPEGAAFCGFAFFISISRTNESNRPGIQSLCIYHLLR